MVFPIDLTPNYGEQHNTATDIARARLLVHQLNAYIQTCQQVDQLMNTLDELRGGMRDTTTLFSNNALFRRQFNQLYSSRTVLEELAPIVHGHPRVPQTPRIPVLNSHNYNPSNVRQRTPAHPPGVQTRRERNIRTAMNVQSPLLSPTGSNLHSIFRQTPTNYINATEQQQQQQSPPLSPNEAAVNAFLGSPVHVAPSIDELNRASRLLPFAEIIHPLNDICPISLNRFNESTPVVQLVYCGHIFLPHLFNRWFRENTRCPVCRHDVRLPLNMNVQTPSYEEAEEKEDDDDSHTSSSSSNNSPPLHDDDDEEGYASSSSNASSVEDARSPVVPTRTIVDIIATINTAQSETISDIENLTNAISSMHSANGGNESADSAIINELLERILANTRR